MRNLTIDQWLLGSVDYSIPDLTLAMILFNNGLESGCHIADTTEKQRDLCLADLLMWLASSSTSSSGEYISDNGWIHQKSAKNATDRAGLRARALQLYAKWGIDKSGETAKIVMKNLY